MALCMRYSAAEYTWLAWEWIAIFFSFTDTYTELNTFSGLNFLKRFIDEKFLLMLIITISLPRSKSTFQQQ